jgi:hypothetical protein
LLAPVVEERDVVDEERAPFPLRQIGECHIDFALVAGIEDYDLPPNRAACLLRFT